MASRSLFQSDTAAHDLGLSLLGQLGTGDGLLSSVVPLRAVLMQMLTLYSSAVLVIAGFIVLYYFTLVIVDAAKTGQAFRRIDPVWGPLRLVIAIGILVPLGGGLNSGQLMVLQLSQWGSGLASQLWQQVGEDSQLVQPMIARPGPVPALALVRALVLRDACVAYTTRLAYEQQTAYRRAREAIKSDKPANDAPVLTPPTLYPVLAQPVATNADGSQTTPYGWTERPYFCGSTTIFPPTPRTEETLFNLLKQAHVDGLRRLEGRTQEYAQDYLQLAMGQRLLNNRSPLTLAEIYETELRFANSPGFNSALGQHLSILHNQLRPLGWVGAPAYLDSILRLNLRLISLNASLPQIDPPEVLIAPPPLATATAAETKIYELLHRIDRSWGDVARVPPLSAAGLGGLSTLLSHAVALSREVPGTGAAGHQLRVARDLMQTSDYDWATFARQNPLVGLAELGTYLTGKAAGLLAGAGVLDSVGPVTGPMVVMITALGLMAFVVSIALLLVLPLIPLVRFFLGVAVWLVEVFEALIAIPLVALAHLRADEHGLAGQSAILCYLMILKIMLRPALMVLGLLGGFILFLILLGALNSLLAGSMPGVINSGQISSLWFVLVSGVYALLLLGIANACFKLIDWLPQRTLTWLQGLLQPGRNHGQTAPEPTA